MDELKTISLHQGTCFEMNTFDKMESVSSNSWRNH